MDHFRYDSRVMVKPLPSRFNPDLLARDGTRYEVDVPQAQFTRLSTLLSSAEHSVRATAGFSRRKDHIVISGRLKTDFSAECQRCLEPMVLSIDEPFELVFVDNEAAAQQLAKELDPVILDETGQIHVVDLFEDELILHIPEVPKHAGDQACELMEMSFGNVSEVAAADVATETQDVESRQRPFDVLKDLDIR